MKPHPRIRKTIKWGGAAVTVLLLVVWVGSARWQLQWNHCIWGHTLAHGGRGQVIEISGGLVKLAWGADLWDSPPEAPWMYGRARFWRVWYHWYQWDTKRLLLWFPLWIPAVVAAGFTAAAWRLDTLARRRAKLNLCPKCGYDRTGLASKDAKCPECGAVPASV